MNSCRSSSKNFSKKLSIVSGTVFTCSKNIASSKMKLWIEPNLSTRSIKTIIQNLLKCKTVQSAVRN